MKLIKKLDRYLEDKNFRIIIKENQINIQNFDEVINLSPITISLRCNNKIIDVEGKDLLISKMIDDEVLIIGKIINVRIN